jgi:hypothetical protein
MSADAVAFYKVHEGEVEEEDIATGMALVRTYITRPDHQDRARRAFMLTTITKQRMYDAFEPFLELR